jgi:hypothetical protein
MYANYDRGFLLGVANIAILTVATVGAGYSSGKLRRALISFSVFGWGYLFAVLSKYGEEVIVFGWVVGVITALWAMVLPERK